MKTQASWLAAFSFEESLKLVEAINNVSTDAKLTLAAIANPTPPERVGASRYFLKEYLKRLQDVVQAAESDESSPILGTDPRSGELARKYLIYRKSQFRSTGLYAVTLSHLLEIIDARVPADLEELINCLGDLRELVEQHSQSDVNAILGEL